MDKIGVAVIGVGAQGSGVHVPACYSHDILQLVAVADIQKKKLERIEENYDIPYYCLDYHDVLDMKEIEAVIIALPNHLHAPIAIDALRAGKHVLVEKPMAMNACEAQKMLEARDENNRILLVGQNNRFASESQLAKGFINDGQAGDIYLVEASWWRRRCGQRGWFIDKKRSGGGALVDIGVHALDLAWWLMGRPRPEYVLGATYSKFGDVIFGLPTVYGDFEPDTQFTVDDAALALIKFENGAVLSLGTSWASNSEDRGIEIKLRGTRAGLYMDSKDGLRIFGDWDGDLVDMYPSAKKRSTLHDHYAACIRGKEEPVSRAEDGLVVMKMLDAIYESAKTGGAVRIV